MKETNIMLVGTKLHSVFYLFVMRGVFFIHDINFLNLKRGEIGTVRSICFTRPPGPPLA